MMLVDESYLHNITIVRIGEEMGIFKNPNESKIEYVMRVIQELQFKNPEVGVSKIWIENWENKTKNELKNRKEKWNDFWL